MARGARGYVERESTSTQHMVLHLISEQIKMNQRVLRIPFSCPVRSLWKVTDEFSPMTKIRLVASFHWN